MPSSPTNSAGRSGGGGRSLANARGRPSHPGAKRLDTRLASRVLATVVLELPTQRHLSDQEGLLTDVPTIVVPEDRVLRLGEPVGVHLVLTQPQIALQGRGLVRAHQRIAANRYRTAITVELGGDEGDFSGVARGLAAGEEIALLHRDRRFLVRLPAKTHSTGETSMTAVVRDLSRSGMRLEMQNPPDVGESLRVRLRPPGAHPFEVMTSVQRIAPGGVGVRLLHISPRASAALNALYARISVLASLALS